MAVDIIVEDGTNVPSANSYNAVNALELFADQRGINLPSTADGKARLLIKAMDYLTLFNDRWLGVPTYADQALAWPRKDIMIDHEEWDNETIPEAIIEAQLHLACYAATGIELTPVTAAGLPVTMDKVGPLETRYASPMLLAGADWKRPKFPVVDALLKPWLAAGFGLTTVRV
jgi:hypothetical protein